MIFERQILDSKLAKLKYHKISDRNFRIFYLVMKNFLICKLQILNLFLYLSLFKAIFLNKIGIV